MLYYIFLALSLAGSACFVYTHSDVQNIAVLWQAPLAAIVSFLLLVSVFCCVLLCSVALVSMQRRQQRRSTYYDVLLRAFCSLAFPLAKIQLQVSGLDHLPPHGNFLLVCNHLSIFDPVILLHALPRRTKLSFLTKQENYAWPIVRQFMHKLQCLSLDRDNDRQALRVIRQAVKILQTQDSSIAVFPEGKISRSGQLLPFRNGAFKIAQRAACPIVVAVLQNTPALKKNLFRRKTLVQVRLVGCIPTHDLCQIRTSQIGAQIHSMMADVLH